MLVQILTRREALPAHTRVQVERFHTTPHPMNTHLELLTLFARSTFAVIAANLSAAPATILRCCIGGTPVVSRTTCARSCSRHHQRWTGPNHRTRNTRDINLTTNTRRHTSAAVHGHSANPAQHGYVHADAAHGSTTTACRPTSNASSLLRVGLSRCAT